ncbi:type IX secretion system membrane protein PorP/SprF [Flaviaesturariibacter flavus]|uniref:Type IX secretion system membrane protein PorP/SprF n=1 Tax=Flaviaesturariibacter flavus TaxID=2502780 RepID=A0A4R1BJZ1_9BACT|nr:type IX secretion system membrane protein PorP/SprF [Flaviaesturariibacter flavus]TCJ17725.1 type IX secretion system membrane protein PorP/SprF [Flaviaesturariibacter flavus]
MKTTITGLLMLMAFAGQAQQKPHYTQYVLNQYIINPAITGIENYTDLKLSHRQQWVGINDAPATTYFTIHAPLGKQDYRTTATSYGMKGENTRGKSYWEEYGAAIPHHGIGFQLINDKTGPISTVTASFTYAYHLGLTPRMSLSGGFGLGVSRLQLDQSKLDFGSGSIDPAVSGNTAFQKLKPDISAGLYLYSSDFFVGLSAQQIVPAQYSFSNGAIATQGNKTVPHIFVVGGYRLGVGEDFNLMPSVLVKYISPLPMQVDLNLKLMYQDRAWIGGSFRKEDGFAGMIGLNVSNTFNVGYSYDYTTSGLRSYTKGTHEIMIGFLIGNRYGDSCPRNLW